MILGCDAAGRRRGRQRGRRALGDQRPGWRGDETLDPKRSLLSERHQGTFAERVVVPRRNLVPKPPELSFERGRVPADGVADGVPDALHPRGGCSPARPCSSRARAAASRRR